MNCLLCGSQAEIFFSKTNKQNEQLDYWLCQGDCKLAFLDPSKHLSNAEERARYDEHDNIAEAGYVLFLERLTSNLVSYLESSEKENLIGLDFGCGPNPVLSTIIQKAGYSMNNYDPYYFPDKSVLKIQYDFITSTEVLEHVYRPAEVIGQLQSLLKPGGILAIMTETMLSPECFADWWYHRDVTHVCFYSEETLHWIADNQGWDITIPQKNVVLFT